MPLTTLNASSIIEWVLSLPITGFDPLTQGAPGRQQFSMAGVDTTKYNQLLAVFYSIPVGANQDFDLSSYTALTGETEGFTLNGALLVAVYPTAGDVVLSPSPTNGLTWFFGSASDKTTCKASGVFFYANAAAGPSQTVTSASRNLRLTNNGAAAATGYFIAYGG